MSDWTRSQHDPELPDETLKEVLELYKSGLDIPAVKPARQFLLCPVGLVASGKTTVLKPLAERLNAVRVSTDEIRQILKQRHFNYNRTSAMAYTVIKELLDGGYSVAVDGNCGSEGAQKRVEELKKRPDIRVIWFRVDPPEEFIINKLRHYKHTWLFRDADEAVASFYKYKEKYGDFSELDLPYVYTFDTSRPDLDTQIGEAAAIMEKELR